MTPQISGASVSVFLTSFAAAAGCTLVKYHILMKEAWKQGPVPNGIAQAKKLQQIELGLPNGPLRNKLQALKAASLIAFTPAIIVFIIQFVKK